MGPYVMPGAWRLESSWMSKIKEYNNVALVSNTVSVTALKTIGILFSNII